MADTLPPGTSFGVTYDDMPYFVAPAPLYASDFQKLTRRDAWLKNFKVGAAVMNISPDENADTLHDIHNPALVKENIIIFGTQIKVTPGSDLGGNGTYFAKTYTYPENIWDPDYCPLPVATCWYIKAADGTSRTGALLFAAFVAKKYTNLAIDYRVFVIDNGININSNDVFYITINAVGVGLTK